MTLPPRRREAALFALLLLLAVDAAREFHAPLLLGAATVFALAFWSDWKRPLGLVALGALLLAAAAHAHMYLERRGGAGGPRVQVASALAALEKRKEHLVVLLSGAAARAAALPETQAALAGDRLARSRLFTRLDEIRQPLREGTAEPPALAVYAVPASTVAWAGRVADLAGLEDAPGASREVFLLVGSVSTTLVATAPVRRPNGDVRGLAIAELPVAVHRNIRNQFLQDFDVLAGDEPGLELHYLDVWAEPEGIQAFVSSPPGVVTQEAVLRAPDGGVLALARATAPPEGGESRITAAFYRRGVATLACLALLVWAASSPMGLRLRWAVAATGIRLILAALGPPLPAAASPALSPDAYASPLLGSLARDLGTWAFWPAAARYGARFLDPLLRSPLDLLLTAGWLFLLALLLAGALLARDRPRASLIRTLASVLAGSTVLVAGFAWLADTLANCSLDLTAVSLLPLTFVHFVLQTAFALILASAGMALLGVALLAGRWPVPPKQWLPWLALWTFAGLVCCYWPGSNLPRGPALTLWLGAAFLGGTSEAWVPRLRGVTTGARAGGGLLLVAALGLLLYASLAPLREQATRSQVEREDAPLVLRQPHWREYVLSESRRKIDALKVLEEAPPRLEHVGIEELAFSVWSDTNLAAFGFSSAVDIQDPSGAVISRFALNLPSLSGTTKALPAGEAWEVTPERLTVGSSARSVLHARRRLVYHRELHGAIHLYVGDDFWNLPFVTGRDPYSILYRTAARGASPDRFLGLIAYDWSRAVVFSSTERPPALDATLLARVHEGPFWTTLLVDGQIQSAFVFSDREGVYAIFHPRPGFERDLGDVVEGAAGLTVMALLALLLVMALRTLLRRPDLSLASLAQSIGERFSLRLFVAFICLAFVPMAVLQVVVRAFVAERLWRESEDQALERAAVAKKAVEDYAFFQRGEAPGDRPVTDTALVWVASLVKNDLDVFERGRLLASSKRELYASGLLPPRLSGSVFRSLVLEGEPARLSTETIGGFSYRVVSVPVRLVSAEPGVLSMPLASREKEVAAALDDLDHEIRVASFLFLAAAALLAQSMARRISGPLRDLTAATQRIAQGDLGARVATTRRDELRRLVESFNQMAADLERQRRDLERSNRLAAWAEMARQVAHEVKNPLTPIQLSAEHLRRVFADPSVDFRASLETCTETILKQVRILRGIVTEFSAFARPPGAVLEPHDLALIVEDALGPYRAALPPGVTLRFESEADLPTIQCDRRLLERAIVNLLENALQAVGEAGTIRVRLRAVSNRQRVEAEIEDSGPGIPPELHDRVFEPFFSTKTSGSGLGLALVKKIAEDHGGGVALRSAPGAPTQAILWLPATLGPRSILNELTPRPGDRPGERRR